MTLQDCNMGFKIWPKKLFRWVFFILKTCMTLQDCNMGFKIWPKKLIPQCHASFWNKKILTVPLFSLTGFLKFGQRNLFHSVTQVFKIKILIDFFLYLGGVFGRLEMGIRFHTKMGKIPVFSLTGILKFARRKKLIPQCHAGFWNKKKSLQIFLF